MSVAGKSMSLLLRRCFGPLTATRTRTLCVFLQRPSWPSSSRPGSVRNLRPWSIFTSQDRFCTTVLEEKTFQPSQVNEDEPEKKDVFVVQVKGIPWTSTSADLLQFFSDCNVSNGESGIHLIPNADGRPSGRAFVELEQSNDVRRALEKHMCNLDNRYLEVYELTNQQAEELMQSCADTRVVRVRGLPRSCSEDEVNLFFKGLQINQDGISIVLNNKGQCSGTGFVQFSTQEEADEALKRDKSYIGSRYIDVFPSNVEELLSSRRTSKSSPREKLPQRSSKSGPLSQQFIHMRGLPFHVSGNDIVKFFQPLVLSRILIECRGDGRPSGEADVWFSSHQEAVEAMRRDRQHLGNRYIELFLKSADDTDGR